MSLSTPWCCIATRPNECHNQVSTFFSLQFLRSRPNTIFQLKVTIARSKVQKSKATSWCCTPTSPNQCPNQISTSYTFLRYGRNKLFAPPPPPLPIFQHVFTFRLYLGYTSLYGKTWWIKDLSVTHSKTFLCWPTLVSFILWSSAVSKLAWYSFLSSTDPVLDARIFPLKSKLA